MTGSSNPSGPCRLSLDGGGWLVRPFLGDEWRQHRAQLPGPLDDRRWWQSTVPGSIVTDAVRAGAVPDPYRGLNSRACEWLADRTLVYRKGFSAAVRGGQRATLVLQGVDYSGRVFCDGIDLGRHEGQFTPFTADLTPLLTAGEEHLLAVVLDPAPASEPQVGRTDRVRLAKTRMSYGWDFCPRLLHQGIWRSALVDVTGPARIRDLRVDSHPPGSEASGAWAVTITVRTDPGRPSENTGAVTCTADITGPDGSPVATETCGATPVDATTLPAGSSADRAGIQTWSVQLVLDDPRLWWPNGFGDRPMYRATVTARVGGTVSDRREVRFALRTLDFRRADGADAGSLPYIPVVNGVAVPVRGWNWVPADLAYGAVPGDRIRHLVRLAADSGATMLRVWGGGLLETDEFYRACDEAGMLVWQEFVQSSSGIASTPSEDPGFVRRLAAEADIAVRERHHHPSLVIWCGGNELTDAAGRPLDATHPALAALAEVVRRADPDRLFLPTSPSGPTFSNKPVDAGQDAGGGPGRDGRQHDVHGPWEHQGLQQHYARYDRAGCQLLSEFGAEGMAYPRVLEHVLGADALVLSGRGTELWDHLGRWWNNEDLVRSAFGGAIGDIEQLSRCSQFLQADGLGYAVQALRRRWPECAGTLVWQLDEPFPNAWCTSAIDHTGAPKPAYHAVAQAHRPMLPCAQLPAQTFAGYPGFGAELMLLCDGPRPTDSSGVAPTPGAGTPVAVNACAHDLYGTELSARGATVAATPDRAMPAGSLWTSFAAARTSTVLLTVRAEAAGARHAAASRYLVTAAADLAELLALPMARVEASVEGSEGDAPWRVRIHNTGSVAAVFIRLRDGRPHGAAGWMVPGDSGFHLLPGEARTVSVRWDRAPRPSRLLAMDGFNVPTVTFASDGQEVRA